MDLFDLIIFIARPSKKGEIMAYKMSKIKKKERTCNLYSGIRRIGIYSQKSCKDVTT